MAGCCNSRGCDEMFDDRFARKSAVHYRKRGLSPAATRMVDVLTQRGIDGASVLEIGGGLGEISLELLKRGAAHSTTVELSPAYDAQARQLIADAGLTGRAERRIADIATDPGAVEPADVVVMHRVVCCYPDYVALLGAAADHARQHLAFTHPPRNLGSRAVVGLENASSRLRHREFRAFVHPPAAMRAVLVEHGLAATSVRRRGVWQVVAASRDAAS